MSATRFPLEPLARLAGVSVHHLLESNGITGKGWTSARHRGVTLIVADRLAVAYRFHPANVWPLEWELETAARLDRERARQRRRWERRGANERAKRRERYHRDRVERGRDLQERSAGSVPA